MTYSIGKIFGIEVNINLLTLIVVGLGAYQWMKYGIVGALFGAALMCILFFCILLHEFGHSLMAQRFGIPVQSITLHLLGGLALLGRKPKNPMQGLLISIAGPAVNVVLSLAALGAILMLMDARDVKQIVDTMPVSWRTMLVIICINNMALAVFNLIPAYPMDGGQVLLHSLSFKIDPSKAMRIATITSRIVATIIGAYAIYHLWFMVTAICVFVFISAPTRKVHRDEIYG